MIKTGANIKIHTLRAAQDITPMQPRGRNYVRIYFSGICSTCPVYRTLLLRPFSFTISV